MNCEIHLTFHNGKAKEIEELGLHGWKFSVIVNDPVLGDKPFCYLTTYAENAKKAFDKIEEAKVELAGKGIHPLREKIEVIIHDKRF